MQPALPSPWTPLTWFIMQIKQEIHVLQAFAFSVDTVNDEPWPTKIHGRICHIWRPKLRGQFFKKTWQSEDRDLYYVLVGFAYSAIFFPKRRNQITFKTMLKNFNMKNFKMRPPVPLFNLFQKSSMILYLFLKA